MGMIPLYIKTILFQGSGELGEPVVIKFTNLTRPGKHTKSNGTWPIEVDWYRWP